MSVQLLNESRPTARKAHQCSLCLLPIPVGMVYVNQRCADGSTAWTYKAHERCDNFYASNPDFYWLDGELPDPAEFREMLALDGDR